MPCPGHLNAKTLRETDTNAVEYKEWFTHNDVKPFLILVRQVIEAFHFTGTEGCVLAFDDLENGRGLLFRFRRLKGDSHGRLHNRVEVFLINKASLPELLDGGFAAVPDEAASTFNISPTRGEALPPCGRKVVGEVCFDVWGLPDSFYFSEIRTSGEKTSEDGGVTGVEVPQRKGMCYMARVIIVVVLLMMLAAGGYMFWQSRQIDALGNRLSYANEQLEKCRADNQRLRKWVADREKFHKDMDNLKDALRKVRDGLSEGEKLLGMFGTDLVKTNASVRVEKSLIPQQ